MMTTSLIWAGAAVLVAVTLCAAALSAWRGWLKLKHEELAMERDRDSRGQQPGALIELASVRERLRRLEAIANGVEL